MTTRAGTLRRVALARVGGRARTALALVLATLALSPAAAIAQDAAAVPSPLGKQAPGPAKAPEKTDASPAGDEEIRFESDTVTYNSDADVVTASGNVVLRRKDQTVRANQVNWNRKTGQIVASGNIRTVDDNGNVLYTEKIELTQELKAGAIEDLLLVLREGGRLAARHGTRDEAGNVVLETAAYTACSIEDDNGCPKKPSWEITAARVTYDEKRKKVHYKGATFHLFGVALLPLPGLGHPSDGHAESGLLLPNVRSSASNGFELRNSYYLRFDDNRDLTLDGFLYTNALPMFGARFRQLTDLGAFQATGYITQSRRISVAGTPTSALDLRGYVESNGHFQLSPAWSATYSARYASDRTFLRRYDLSNDDELRSTVNVERIDRDSYLSLAGWAVQTLRPNRVQGLVPLALPAFDYRRRFTDLLPGTLEVEANTLAITRSAGQDTQRAFIGAEWNLRTITKAGQVLTLTALARGDVYHSSENALTSQALYRGLPGWQGRGIATIAADMRWPFVGAAFGGTQVFTPRVQLVASPTIRNLSIPNEDSRAVDLETSNLFELNRFPGYDRVEGGARITYGFDWQLDRPGWRIATTLGQSYRLSNQNSLIPDGTGLSNKLSDVVGRTSLRFKDLVAFTWRYRLDKDSFALRRNEIDATIGNHRTYVEVGYLSLDRNIDPAFEDLQDRQEVRFSARAAFRKYYSIFGSTIVNLTRNATNPALNGDGFQLLRHRLGVAYTDDCLDISFTWRRDYVTTGDAKKGNTFQFSLALRNIGIR